MLDVTTPGSASCFSFYFWDATIHLMYGGTMPRDQDP